MDENDYLVGSLTNSEAVDAARFVSKLARVANNPINDGFTQCHCKHQLYLLKCLLEDLYKDLPDFPEQEKEWEQQRLMEILKR